MRDKNLRKKLVIAIPGFLIWVSFFPNISEKKQNSQNETYVLERDLYLLKERMEKVK